MDVWLIEPASGPTGMEAATQAPHLKACRMQQRSGSWYELQSGLWSELAGSPEFLTSLQLPETEVCLVLPKPPENIPKPNNSSDLVASAYWASHSPHRGLRYTPLHPWQSHLIEQVRTYGKSLKVCFKSSEINPTQKDHLAALTPHEIRALRSNDASRNTSPGAMLLLLLRHPSPARLHWRLGTLVSTCVLAAMVWHVLPGWVSETQQSARVTLLQTLKKAETVSAQPDWEAAITKLGKFGRGNRANLRAVQWAWNTRGELLIEGQLNRPRKRLPKGCVAQKNGWVECPLIEAMPTP